MILFAIEINTIMPSNCTTILHGHQMQPQTFCNPKVKHKISHNCVGITSFHFIAMYSKIDGVTWCIVMVIWWTRYWTRDLDFISFNLWSYLDMIYPNVYNIRHQKYSAYICAIFVMSCIVSTLIPRCWPYNLLPEQPFAKHEFWGQCPKSHWNTIVVKLAWII